MKRATIASLSIVGLILGLTAYGTAQTAQLEVTEILLGTSLEGGVPTAPTTSFSRSDPSIYCMVRFRNRTGAEGHIRIAFERATDEPSPGARGRRFPFPARNRYRTVSRGTPNRAAGNYRCVVRTDEGAVLSHQDFRITE